MLAKRIYRWINQTLPC